MKPKVAIITGAGSGIGRAVAAALAKKGYQLLLAGRRLGPLEETAALLDPAAPVPLTLAVDVTVEDDVVRLFAAAQTRFGRVDLVFNNAGVSGSGARLEDTGLDEWRRVTDTNLTGAFLCLREAFRLMKHQSPQGGRIINNGSVSAHSPRPNSAAYTASKHAMTGLTKSAQLDGRKYHIACCQIDIGNAATEMAQRMTTGVPQADGRIAPEAVMDVANVGEAVAFMDGLSLEANIPFMTLMATTMPLVGRG